MKSSSEAEVELKLKMKTIRGRVREGELRPAGAG